MKPNQNYLAALKKAETVGESVSDIHDCLAIGRACGLGDADVARHRMLTARHRDDPSDAGLAKLREEVANLAERLRDAEAKLEAARNSHAAALQRHAAADRQLGEWTHKLAARDTIVKSDPILAAVLTA